ncbi:DUF6538 domain-containing protein [uncultured Methylobacterium sp.]|uniref:DUF6538 domain-containing protein n=1 Tax=uncultured Methylobacterium sp. TaxID=157278 RepID=UPI0035CB974E
MALRAAQPWSHFKTGVFWFRRAVPRDLRAQVGKPEELASLDTEDRAEARVRHAKVSVEVEIRWANLRAGGRSPSEKLTRSSLRPTTNGRTCTTTIQAFNADGRPADGRPTALLPVVRAGDGANRTPRSPARRRHPRPRR